MEKKDRERERERERKKERENRARNETDLMAVRKKAALLHVAHKTPDGNVIEDKLKIKQLLHSLSQLLHL